MPRLNPLRPIVEKYFRVPIRELFWNSSGIGQPTSNTSGPVPITVLTTPDNNGVIQIGNRQWRVQYRPRSRWKNKWDEYCADYWVIGRNGKRHRYLLVASDGSHAGTVSELGAHYYSNHRHTPTRRVKRRKEILRELLLNSNAADLNLRYVPLTNKPKGIFWQTWTRHEQLRLGYNFVLVRKPYGMHTKRFGKMLAYLNRPHKGKEGDKTNSGD